MNNPAPYQAHNPYAYANPVPQAQMMPSAPPQYYPQTSFPPSGFPDQFQRPLQPQQQQPHQFYPQQQVGLQRPPSQNNISSPLNATNCRPLADLGPGFPPSRPQTRTPPASGPETQSTPPTSAGPSSNAMAQAHATPNQGLAQQAQMQNAAQMTKSGPQPTPALSAESQRRERQRVTVLLDINTALLQEVVSLQTQGKAGAAPSQPQQSPTSPTSATDPNNALTNSPVDASKQNAGKPASQEYADCMRRLQANLSYLASVADAKKKASGVLAGPQIMVPPPHLTQVHGLYKELNALFPEASQSTVQKAIAFAQANRTQNSALALG